MPCSRCTTNADQRVDKIRVFTGPMGDIWHMSEDVIGEPLKFGVFFDIHHVKELLKENTRKEFIELGAFVRRERRIKPKQHSLASLRIRRRRLLSRRAFQAPFLKPIKDFSEHDRKFVGRLVWSNAERRGGLLRCNERLNVRIRFVISRPMDAGNGLAHCLSYALVWMVEILHEVLKHGLVQLEMPSSLKNHLIEQVNFGAFFKRGTRRHIESEPSEPVYKWPRTARILRLEY